MLMAVMRRGGAQNQVLDLVRNFPHKKQIDYHQSEWKLMLTLSAILARQIERTLAIVALGEVDTGGSGCTGIH